MSPTPTPNPDDVSSIFNDGFRSTLFGALAMTARLLLSQEKQTFGYVFRRLVSAMIVAFFASLVVREYISSVSMQFAVVGALAYAGPEVCDFVLRRVLKAASKV